MYFKYVEPNLGQDSSYLGNDPFLRWVKSKGLPVIDYTPPETFHGSGGVFGKQDYITVEATVWEAVVAQLPKPWPATVIDEDVRIMCRDAKNPDIDGDALAARWGVRPEEVHFILTSSAVKVLG